MRPTRKSPALCRFASYNRDTCRHALGQLPCQRTLEWTLVSHGTGVLVRLIWIGSHGGSSSIWMCTAKAFVLKGRKSRTTALQTAKGAWIIRAGV